MKKLSSFWLVFLLVTAAIETLWARGGGGCVEQGTLIRTPSGLVPVEKLMEGDAVMAVIGDHLEVAHVQTRNEVQPEEYLEIITAGRKLKLRVTAEHPIQVERGEFRVASQLHDGDSLNVWTKQGLRSSVIQSVAHSKGVRPAYNLLVSPGGTFLANGVVVHNKGCFLPDTPILRADGTAAAIRDIRVGDALLAFTADSGIVTTKVQKVVTRVVDAYAEVKTERVALRVTMEHPFYVGKGTFKTLEALAPGDSIFAFDGKSLSAQRIVSIERVAKPTTVYNLQADAPNTFFANGIAVHNKGGGCFPARTTILTPQGEVTIEAVKPGNQVTAVDSAGRLVPVRVVAIYETVSPTLVLWTDAGPLRTTAEHPLQVADGRFRVAGELKCGDRVMAMRGGQARSATIQAVVEQQAPEPVFNLRVGAPHTFIADGFVVHNKGGGGGGFHGGSSGGGSNDPVVVFIFVGVMAVFIVIVVLAKKKQERDEDLDFVYRPSAVAPKADKTQKLLEFIAKVDPPFAPDALRQVARSTFDKLQQCWEARDYGPMQPLMMPDLYAQHCAQLNGLRRDHEINVIDGLGIERVDIVNVRYTEKENQREFTALITAHARDYYVDDRTRQFLRGDNELAQFQEFWTFHRQNGQWLLREIEQSRESDALKEENFFQQFTDQGVKQVYGESAGATGPAGPWLEKETETKATRIERMLNFLAQTDKLWDRQPMIERARQVFTHVLLAQESGDPAMVPGQELFPEVAAHLQDEVRQRKAQGLSVEYRNFCVRKVELILVRNFTDNTRDEFVTRISAHAQKIVTRGGAVLSEDEYVSPFMEYWTFGRLDGQWKLKEVLPPAAGAALIGQENVDEDSSKPQLQWYYRQTRAN